MKRISRFTSFLMILVMTFPTPLFAGRKHKNVEDIGNRKINGRIAGIFPNFISQEREIQLGAQFARQFEETARLVEDPVVTEYIDRLGQKIVRRSDAKVPFFIKVVDTDEVNAFALPGGYLYVNKGLILEADNESELAGVLAHEIAHVTARHATERLSKGRLLQFAAVPALFVGGGLSRAGIQNGLGLGLNLAVLGITRKSEAEADQLGTQYLWNTGYDPHGFITFFEKLEARQKISMFVNRKLNEVLKLNSWSSIRRQSIFILTALLLILAAIGVRHESDSMGDLHRVPSPSGVLPPGAEPSPTEMVYISGGSLQMGSRGGHSDEQPVHEVRLTPFLLDPHEVTNRQFTAFVRASGYLTQAEKLGHCWGYLEGQNDFVALQGANWLHPHGPDSSITERMDHPVVCVSWHDAAAYAAWAGKRLPTEAEWEYAARSGRTAHLAAQLDNRDPAIHHPHSSGNASDPILVQANVWQGTWPVRNNLADGYYYTAPVGQYGANGYGLYDMIGNVWEWCADWYAGDYYTHSAKENPFGPKTGENRVARGGSWFCSRNYCQAFSTHFRGASPPDHSFNNVGFRCAKDL